MRIGKSSLFLVFALAVLTLPTACNLGVVQPEASPLPVAIVETPTFVIPPPVEPTATPTLIPTIVPTATVTLFHSSIPTLTPTSQWTGCPGIVVKVDDTKKGDILNILRCDDGLEYQLGPLAKGVYAVGPNNNFLIYVSFDGIVYAARIGDRYLNPLYNLGREHIFTVFNKKVAPDFQLSFTGEGPIYRLVILEKNYDQKRMYELPIGLTE
ncbi:MAG TPA: hypothetical protein PKC52_03445 [Anaerolineales bacterium]|nr:hypothetical protein [Anaerolineales bacterium]